MKKIVVAMSAVILCLSVGEVAAAKVCKSKLAGRSVNRVTTGLARSNALAAWQIDVTKKYSLQWANWGNASNKTIRCRTRTTIVGANIYWCRATAKPCIFQ